MDIETGTTSQLDEKLRIASPLCVQSWAFELARPLVRFTHLINPFVTTSGSEHDVAQRVTFASLRNAVRHADERGIGVEVLAAVYPEDAPAVEAPARTLAQLNRSVLDFCAPKPPRRLPLIGDLLRIARTHGRGEYLIFSNIDIALQREFYSAVDDLVSAETPRPLACCINRRTIRDGFQGPEALELMYLEEGHEHPGYDCFVFPLAWVDELDLGNACIGARHFDSLVMANLDVLSGFNVRIFFDLRLTFHLGNDRSWVSRIDYEEFNLRECLNASRRLCERSSPPAGSLFKFLHDRFESHNSMRHRMIRHLKRSDLLVRAVRRLREGIG
jgi:hypothetical protein